MASRYKDWIRQARRDLEHARYSMERQQYEWACFAAHQAAEKALKAVYQKMGADAWGHSVTGLLQKLEGRVEIPVELLDCARQLDKHYIPPRYPNSYPTGAPMDYYTLSDAEQAICNAERIIRFCEDQLV